MDIAVLSDIHGNYVALEQCIKYAVNRQITTFIFLGDYLGELAYPQKTMEILYNLSARYTCYFIRGNKEGYWIDYQAWGEKGWKNHDSTTGSLLYTYSNLTERDIHFFKELPHKRQLHFEGLPSITICHGSPDKINEDLRPENARTYEVMEQSETDLIVCGHTHEQCVIEHHGKKILNPGSVGVALCSNGLSQFLILHGEDGIWSEELISLSYDVEKVIADLGVAGLDEAAPGWCKVTKHLLRTGEISHARVLRRAMQLCQEAEGVCNWPDIPEEYWEQAVEDMLV